MMTTRTKAAIGLALLAAVLLNVRNVWAEATTIPLPTVEFTYMGVPGPETRIWTTDGQVQHIRSLPYDLAGVGDGLTITTIGVCNHNRSLERLDGNFWGHDESVAVTWGELTGTFQGTHSGKTINWVGYSTHVYHGISGDFEGCKLMLDGIFDYATKSGVLEGTLLVTGAVDTSALTLSAEAAAASAGADRDPASVSGTVDLATFTGTATIKVAGEELTGTVAVIPVLPPEPKDGGLYFPVVEHWFTFDDGSLVTTGQEFVMPTDEDPETATLHGDMEIIPESATGMASSSGRFEGTSGKLRVNGQMDWPPVEGQATFEANGVISYGAGR